MNPGQCAIHDDRDPTGVCSCSAIVSDLRAALDAALQLRIGDERLITVMRRRYGREAHQWRANHDQRKTERDRALKENAALSKVYGVAAGLRQFPVPFNDHFELVGAVDECRQALHDLTYREVEDEIPAENPST